MRASAVALLCLFVATTALPPHARAAADDTGTIRGRVTLASTDFVNPPIRMGVDPACAALRQTRPTQEFVVRAADGGLANVFVRLKGDYPVSDAPAPVVRLEQRGCVYAPHVIGLRVGQTLEVVNSDPTAHNVHALSEKGNAFNISQTRGAEPFRFTARAEELMMRITCDTHAWMNIYVGVVNHPFFAVTGADGTFALRGVPAGHHRISVWHERFGPLEADAEVRPGEDTVVTFGYAGTEKPAAPE